RARRAEQPALDARKAQRLRLAELRLGRLRLTARHPRPRTGERLRDRLVERELARRSNDGGSTQHEGEERESERSHGEFLLCDATSLADRQREGRRSSASSTSFDGEHVV